MTKSAQEVHRTQQAAHADPHADKAIATEATFADNHAPSTAQRALADTIAQSPRMVTQRAAADQIHNSPRMAAQRQKMAAFNGGRAPMRKTEDDELLQARLAADTPTAQLHADPAPAPRPNNTGLPDALKAGVETLSGMALDDVKVHYNSARPAQLQALAHAQGNDIHIGPGQERHLPHEAWHVVQQKQGRVQATVQAKGVAINTDKALEQEADVMGAKAAQQAFSPDPSISMPDGLVRNGGAPVQKVSVIQLFADTGAANAWLLTQMPLYSANAWRLQRLQPYIDSFTEMVALWDEYGSEANELSTTDASDKLNKMYLMALALEALQAQVDAQIQIETAKNALPARVDAIAFTRADSWYRQYANAYQSARMTQISGLYSTQTGVRNGYAGALQGISTGIHDVAMNTLEDRTTGNYRAGVLALINQAKLDFPVAALAGILDEVTVIKAAVEAAALLAVNIKFANLNAALAAFERAHTEGSGLNVRRDALRAYHAAHDDAVVDQRNVDARLVEAETLKEDARLFVNAQFADIAEYVLPVRDFVETSMFGNAALAHHGERLAQIDAFLETYNDTVLDDRDYRDCLASADQLNTEVTAWADLEFVDAGGAGAAIVTVPDFEAAAAPGVRRRAQFRSLIRQNDIAPGAVSRRFYSNQDVVGGYTYSFTVGGAAGTAIHAHFLANDALGGAHFKPRGMPAEGEVGHGVNQLTPAQIAIFVTAPKLAYDGANGVPPANVRRPP